MEWMAATALYLSVAALAVVFYLWRRVSRLERSEARTSPAPVSGERGIFGSVELSLEAMLEELELKEREILARIERRERELFEGLDRSGEQVSALADAAQEAPAPAGGTAKVRHERASGDAATATLTLKDEKVVAVLRLAAEGHDVVTIAKRLGLGKGEVALILKLGQ